MRRFSTRPQQHRNTTTTQNSTTTQKCFDAAFLNTPGAAAHCGLRDVDVDQFRMQVALTDEAA